MNRKVTAGDGQSAYALAEMLKQVCFARVAPAIVTSTCQSMRHPIDHGERMVGSNYSDAEVGGTSTLAEPLALEVAWVADTSSEVLKVDCTSQPKHPKLRDLSVG